jgi:hypothetical protein
VSLWLTIEVFDGASPASLWRYAHGESLLEAAVTNGVSDWEWHLHEWGVVLELRFSDDERREQFRSLPMVLAALDAVPDPAAGLLVYVGRGGGAGAAIRRRPRRTPPSGAVALPEPIAEPLR